MTATEPGIEQVIARVQGGDLEAYRAVVNMFHRRLRNLLAGLCPPSVDYDEISHLAFVEAYRRIGQYRSNTNFFAWLAAIARNLLRAEIEKVQRRARNEHNYLEHVLAQQLDRLGDEPPELMIARGTYLGECLEQLKSEARELLAMRYGDGLRVQDIAQRQSRSADALSVQLFGLRKVLRDCIGAKLSKADSHQP